VTHGNTRHAIDIHEHDKINETTLKELVCAAVELDTSESARTRPFVTVTLLPCRRHR